MEIECVGVGDACDPIRGNVSVAIHGDTTLLVDCGFAVPALYLPFETDPNYLDAIYFTHFHADHFFGVVGLIVSWYVDKREKPLTIIGQPGVKDRFETLINMGYQSLLSKLPFELKFIETIDPVKFGSLLLTFALTEHSQKNYAVRVDTKDGSVGISGDGIMTDDSKALFIPCTILIHDAFTMDEPMGGHDCAKNVVKAAANYPYLKQLVFVHLEKNERLNHSEAIVALGSSKPFKVTVPDAGERYLLS